MSKPITLKIDVTKIDKAHLFKGARGTYLDLVLFENKDGEGQYGDTHYVVQGISKEAREAGTRGPIVGNAKVPDDRTHEPARRQSAPPQRPDTGNAQPEDDIPF